MHSNLNLEVQSQFASTQTKIAQRECNQLLSEKMQKLRQRHLPMRTQNKKRKHADKLLQRILRELDVDVSELEIVIKRWENCQSVYTRPVPVNGAWEFRSFKRNCELPFCQRCNSWMKKREAEQMLERFLMLLGDAPMEPKHFSVVTINTAVLPLGHDFTDPKKSATAKIDYRIKKLQGCVMQGEFEISKHRKSNNEPYMGMLHFHGVLYHPNHTRDEVRDELRKPFPEKRAIQVRRTFTERDGYKVGSPGFQNRIEKDIRTYAQYTCDVDICVENDAEKTGQFLFDHLLSICSIWSGGKKGLRYQPGLRRAFKVRNLKFPKPKDVSSRTQIRKLLADGSDDAYFDLSDVLKEELVIH